MIKLTMNPFLKQVAKYLISHPEIPFHKTSIIVPNRRTSVFLTAYINENISKATISPEMLSISDVISTLSVNHESDRISQICLLHQIYCRVTGINESLDEFYFWGEIMLQDFNDIDKYLIDAADLFRNIKDLKEIENIFDYLSEKQILAIKNFWGIDMQANGSTNRTQFLTLWSKLAEIYDEFKKELLKNNASYNGMFYRNIVESWNEQTVNQLQSDYYIFVGFNALNKVEIELFKLFKKNKKCLFFWDYDEEFLLDEIHEAGLFMRRNLNHFPAPSDFELEQGDKSQQEITIISTPSQISQTQILNHPRFLKTTHAHSRFDEMAIVLAEESLLVPTISAVGNLRREINITMGYPISNTAAYSLINLLIDLQRNFRKYNKKPAYYHKTVVSLLNHQLITNPEYKQLVNEINRKNLIYVDLEFFQHDPLLQLVFKHHLNWNEFSAHLLEIISELASRRLSNSNRGEESEIFSLETEYLYHASLGIQQLSDALQSISSDGISIQLYARILQQVISRISIPFEGEPLIGVQVMGVLETRNLDFEQVFMLSVNHGRLPSNENSHSFIPYNLRKAFDLPTYEEHDAMYAYYFYRLLNRAKNIVLVFDSSSNGITTGEMSRYIYQLIFDSNRKITKLELDFENKTVEKDEIAIASTPEHRAKLLTKYQTSNLSPSALNTYLECKLKFYFSYIVGIRESDELEEEIDNRIFGNLFHEAAEYIYKPFENKTLTAEMLEQMAKNQLKLNEAIHNAFAKVIFKKEKNDKIELEGNNKLVAHQLLTYLKKMLRNDQQIAPIQIISLEHKCTNEFKLMVDGIETSINIGGTIDRIDQTDQGIRIIDYKTGRNTDMNFIKSEDLINRNFDKRQKEIFQTLLYCEIISRQSNNNNILPNIYKISQFFDDKYSSTITHSKIPLNYADIQDEFNEIINLLLADLFSPDNVFTQKEKDKCNYCSFLDICGRSEKSWS
ncbi:MAG: PD-(D/E)XK nuclease family protein [Mangrovibacterium sp.]